MDDIQLEKGSATNANKNAEPESSATNANKNVKSSAKTPAPTGSSDDSTGPDLTDDLRVTLNNLSDYSRLFYNNLNNNEDKVAYLKSIREHDLRARRKGV
ncbi:hypothetical protein RhiirC2_776118 [Rhizophagus irregularis]|uniref:Uncharacterized protein n=1 Tax=Rhizophagus irregularis TaxID=588596 RepID=A0A2N1NHK7_9GLOM|nr:hypothetical protein RhiirC2_776118 [Rhizophagus irregularis]